MTFKLKRFGTLMEPESGNPHEVEGVLNPAAVRGNDGNLYLFPRLVAKGNYSRIGIARVRFSDSGDPIGVDRLGIALEPACNYELRSDGTGGCEDPRITYVEPLGHYVMSYVALSNRGPRIALATSSDLINWQRLGLATFEPYKGIEFDGIDNKDSCIFPVSLPDPSGQPSLAILHRPLFPGTRPEEKAQVEDPEDRDLHRECIWISYREMAMGRDDPTLLCRFTSHRRLAVPSASWEELKIGIGAPPVLAEGGWLLIYHGVRDELKDSQIKSNLVYSAGAMLLAKDHPEQIIFRTSDPILVPDQPEDRLENGERVVFPTGIDRRVDLGTPNRYDFYFGTADNKIGTARLDIAD